MVKEATKREGIFEAIQPLIDSNKLSGWKVVAAFPEIKPVFPVIVINPARANTDVITIDGGCRINILTMLVEFYANARDGKEKIDQGKDNVENTLRSNKSSLETSKLILHDTSDGEPDNFVFNNQKLNYGSMSVEFELI